MEECWIIPHHSAAKQIFENLFNSSFYNYFRKGCWEKEMQGTGKPGKMELKTMFETVFLSWESHGVIKIVMENAYNKKIWISIFCTNIHFMLSYFYVWNIWHAKLYMFMVYSVFLDEHIPCLMSNKSKIDL